MSKLFPSMCSKPGKFKLFALIPCWIWIFILFPMFMPFVGLGVWEVSKVSTWLDIVYHMANTLLLLALMGGYLKDDWYMVTTDVRYYLKHIGLTVGLMAGAMPVWLAVLMLSGFELMSLLEYLPVVEMSVSHTPLALIATQPIFGTIAVSVFSPISICILFYCLGFAPVCYKKPWLAYLCVAGITLIPPVIDVLWRGDPIFMLGCYLVQLPIHLLACWSYQKTDNVWTPIASLAVANLLASVILIPLFG